MVSNAELLYYVFENRGVIVDDVMNWCKVDKEWANEQLEKLFEDGLVKKNKKSRGIVYTISDKGFKELQYYVI